MGSAIITTLWFLEVSVDSEHAVSLGVERCSRRMDPGLWVWREERRPINIWVVFGGRMLLIPL